MYNIEFSDTFKKRMHKLIPKNKKEDVLSRIRKLAINPYVGKPLRYNFVRELKLEKFRIYFIIYEQKVLVFIVDISDKKRQQEVIESIIEKFIKNLNKGDLL